MLDHIVMQMKQLIVKKLLANSGIGLTVNNVLFFFSKSKYTNFFEMGWKVFPKIYCRKEMRVPILVFTHGLCKFVVTWTKHEQFNIVNIPTVTPAPIQVYRL